MFRRLKYLPLLFTVSAWSQEQLSLSEAIRTALEKNYDVRITRNNERISAEANRAGNAGLTPTVTLAGGVNGSMLNSYQEFGNGTVQDRPGATATGFNASLNADWIVFDGGKMFAVKKRLDAEQERSASVTREQMEQAVLEVMRQYFDVVRIRSLIKAAEYNLSVYDERLKIANVKYEIGSDSKVELLLARSDRNRAQASILQLKQQLVQAMATLNLVMGRSPATDFVTSDSLAVTYRPSADDIRNSVKSSNNTLKTLRLGERISELQEKETRSALFPVVQAGGAWLVNSSSSQAGFILLNRQTGLTGGITARWTLFSGGRNRSSIQQRSLQLMNQRILTEQVTQEIDGLVFVQLKIFELLSDMAVLERQNLADASELSAISLERYRIGKSPLLETMEVQRQLEDAQVRYINALYAQKLAEGNLMKVSGALVK